MFNKRHTLQRALSSILSQTYQQFVIVIVDDGSTDGSLDMIGNSTDPRVTVLKQANQGPGLARNNGALHTDTPLLAFLDADDEWRSDFLQKAVAALSAHQECSAFVSAYDSGLFRDVRPNKLSQAHLAGPTKIDDSSSGYEIKLMVDACHSSSAVIRRDAFVRHGGYFQKWKCLYGEDSYFWLKVVLNEAVYFDQEELTLFHVEDSELGYGSKHQTKARPIATEAADLRANLASQRTRMAFDRVLPVFVDLDLLGLGRSGSLREAAKVRRLHGRSRALGVLADIARFARHRLVD